MPELTPLLDQYLAEYARVERELPGADQPWLQSLRKQALTRFIKAGFPGSRSEDWKYSDTRLLQKQSFELAADKLLQASDIETLVPEGLSAQRLVFVNGRMSNSLSTLQKLPPGVSIDALASVLQHEDAAQAQQLGHELNGHGHALIDLNGAFAIDGACLRLAENTQLEQPLYLLFVGAPTDHAQMMHSRNLIQLAANASATVIEHYVSLGGETYFNDCVTQIDLAANARLRRIRIQTESDAALQVGATLARLQRDSHLTLHSFDLGGRWLRYDSNIRLLEPGAEVHLDGLYAPNGRQHMDNHTRVEHEAPHCISREDYKGILSGAGRGVFNGRIVVHRDAQKTDSEQSSAALLLSAKAELDAKPELEIYADDVKCKHGATVGQLDETAVFYLQSRGLSETEARNLLTWSFADALIARLGDETLQKYVESILLAKLPQADLLEELL